MYSHVRHATTLIDLPVYRRSASQPVSPLYRQAAAIQVLIQPIYAVNKLAPGRQAHPCSAFTLVGPVLLLRGSAGVITSPRLPAHDTSRVPECSLNHLGMPPHNAMRRSSEVLPGAATSDSPSQALSKLLRTLMGTKDRVVSLKS